MLETAVHSQALNERLRALSRRERGLLLVALALSVTAHIAGWLVIDASLRPDPRAAQEYWLPIPLAAAPEVMPLQLAPLPTIENIALETPPAPLETAPIEPDIVIPDAVPIAPPARVGIQQGVAGAAGTADTVGGSGGDPTEHKRIEYRLGPVADVWRPAPRLPVAELSDDDIVRARVAGRLGAYNDSVAIVAAAREKAKDWTVKDAEGGRWGLSPKGVHLGGVTIPLPNFAFAPPPGARRDEFLGRVRSWNDIQGQAARVEGDEVMQDRIKAIRERIEKERAKANRRGGDDR